MTVLWSLAVVAFLAFSALYSFCMLFKSRTPSAVHRLNSELGDELKQKLLHFSTDTGVDIAQICNEIVESCGTHSDSESLNRATRLFLSSRDTDSLPVTARQLYFDLFFRLRNISAILEGDKLPNDFKAEFIRLKTVLNSLEQLENLRIPGIISKSDINFSGIYASLHDVLDLYESKRYDDALTAVRALLENVTLIFESKPL